MQALRSAPPPVTAERLASEVGVSTRTVHRDIDALRGLGALIDGAAGFGFTLIEDAVLPPLGFADEELEALVLGLREVQEIGDPALAEAADSALNKLQARLPERQSHRLKHAVLTARRFQRPAAPAIDVGVLRRATWDERTVAFGYSDYAGKRTHRRVNPLGLAYMDKSTVMIGWCLLREDFRTFRLDRMNDLEVTEESFRPTRVPLLRQAKANLKAEIEALAKRRASGD